jgi:hypothetical protein
MEGAMLFFLFGSLYYFFKWYGDAKFQFPFMWFIFSALLLLLKPHAVIYYLLPLGSLFLWKYRIKVFRQPQLYIMILPVIPVMLWVLHVKIITTADNNVVFYSLVDSVGAREFPPPLLFEVSFYKDIFDKLSGLLLTPLGFTLFLIGICTSYKSKNTGFVYIWGLFTLLYVFVLPRKMVDLSYYLLPVGCVGTFFIAFAIKDVVENKIFLHAFTKRTGKVFLGVTILIISFRYSFAPMFIIPEYDRHVVSAGKYIDENALRNSLVVASHGTSTDLLYYCNRTGWSFSVKREKLAQTFTPQELVYFKKKGKRIFNSPQEHLDYLINEHNASYFVCTPKRDLKANKGFFEYLQTNFSLLEETDGFIIYSLKK